MQDSPKYDPKTKYNWVMSDQDLAHYHIMIVDEMTKLGMTGIPKRVGAFADNETARRTVAQLDRRVKEFMAGVDKKDESAAKTAPTAEKPKAKTKTKPETKPETKPKPESRAKSKAKAKTAKPAAETAGADEGETDMANKRKVTSKKSTANSRTGLDPDAKITVLPAGKENPRRPGTGPHKRYEQILKIGNAKAAVYIEKKLVPTLKRAAKEKLFKIG